jgi:dual specificity tyrosine-phosphorylation-regulated kinase 2/3/4
VIRAFRDDLAPLELSEILNYPEVWYVGPIDSKPELAAYESDYRDRKQQYLAHPNDHIAYRYQVLSHAGGGAFSNVYRCFDHKFHRLVAVKIIRGKPDCLQYAEIEAKIQSQLRGPHSVRLLDSFFWRGHFCLSMESLYTDVYSIIERRTSQQLPPDAVRHVCFQTLLCLRELRRLGIVHADIKPENILTNDDEFRSTKVADFGTACFADQQIFSYIQSRYYRAPEVLYGLRYGPPIDMWSLGCVVYELLTGEPIFPAEDEDELAEMIEIALGPPPQETYSKGTKWCLFPRRNPFHYSKRGREPITFMVARMPRSISGFIRACVVWEPEERMTPDEALASEWIMPEWELAKKEQTKAQMPSMQSKPSPRPRGPWHNR